MTLPVVADLPVAPAALDRLEVRCPTCKALEFVYQGSTIDPTVGGVAIQSRCHRCRCWYEGDLRSDGARLRVTSR